MYCKHHFPDRHQEAQTPAPGGASAGRCSTPWWKNPVDCIRPRTASTGRQEGSGRSAPPGRPLLLGLFSHEPVGFSHLTRACFFCPIRCNPGQGFFPKQAFSSRDPVQLDSCQAAFRRGPDVVQMPAISCRFDWLTARRRLPETEEGGPRQWAFAGPWQFCLPEITACRRCFANLAGHNRCSSLYPVVLRPQRGIQSLQTISSQDAVEDCRCPATS